MNNHQSANAFLQLAHIGLLFFRNRAAMRQAHQLLRFFAQFLALNFAQANNFGFEGRVLFFKQGVILPSLHHIHGSQLGADGVEAVAQTLDFILFDFFHDDLIY